MYVCMYVYMYVCMYVCMYVSIHVYMYVYFTMTIVNRPYVQVKDFFLQKEVVINRPTISSVIV